MEYQMLQQKTDVIKTRGFIQYIFYPHCGLDKTKFIQRAGFTIKSNEIGTVRCFGDVPYMQVGDYFEFEGSLDDSRCLQVKSMVRVDDDYQGATSMLVFCFGPKTAINIIAEFKNDALHAWDQFKNHPDCFINKAEKVKGLGVKKLKRLLKNTNHTWVLMFCLTVSINTV